MSLKESEEPVQAALGKHLGCAPKSNWKPVKGFNQESEMNKL